MNHHLDLLICNLKLDYETYRSMCVYKIEERKSEFYKVEKKCVGCNGFSSQAECKDYTDLLHLIYFYERFRDERKDKKDREGYYK